MSAPQGFHGSYPADDVTFLLRLTEMEATPVEEKERLIQSGQRHYSKMISTESAPSVEHQALYQQALADGLHRLASEVQQLAMALQQRRPARPIVLVSFVRAGVPLGVLLVRALRELGVDSVHYGISIIRDKGIDQAALDWIEQRHAFADIVWVDGWVGKGAIHTQLQASLGERYPAQEIPFAVLADPTGKAWLSASGDDWLIPFGILGATVSGLVSRSILTRDGGWHACVSYQHLTAHDVSQAFADEVDSYRRALPALPVLEWLPAQRQALQTASHTTIQRLVDTYQISNINRLKPGIAEATRAVMRRVPEHIMVQRLDDPNIRLLRHLAESRGIPLQAVGDGLAPYRAITIIKKTT
ncbi:cysteine protease StiP family protein [Candidatus Thiothrix anitrata]|uniref:Cysteine protease StiP family protein n=1 Tax=Candidatus Thiothrix anitrata TaxID=2823902 RepID=A0ABX7X081_9GAMM|nr:cysteine protease StiP family protein [Candidatus Thiothrix anitrata]QTR49376.1 cysteine protease StiP family protein [Candidatus Thiothrix anitrata]